MFVLAMLLVIPAIRICIFSTGKRASGGLMSEITQMLAKIPGGLRRRSKANSEQLWLSQAELAEGQGLNSSKTKDSASEEGVGKLYSFPASVAGKCHNLKHVSPLSLSERQPLFRACRCFVCPHPLSVFSYGRVSKCVIVPGFQGPRGVPLPTHLFGRSGVRRQERSDDQADHINRAFVFCRIHVVPVSASGWNG